MAICVRVRLPSPEEYHIRTWENVGGAAFSLWQESDNTKVNYPFHIAKVPLLGLKLLIVFDQVPFYSPWAPRMIVTIRGARPRNSPFGRARAYNYLSQ